MAKRIYKYPLQLGETILKLPFGAQVLTAQDQGGTITIWALVNTEDIQPETRKFTVVGTGHTLPDSADVSNWIATLQQGQYVWHVFELPQSKS